MKNTKVVLILLIATVHLYAKKTDSIMVKSPDKKISVTIAANENGIPVYSVNYLDSLVIEKSTLGVLINDADLSQNLKIKEAGKTEQIRDTYTLLNNKKTNISYIANQQVIGFNDVNGLILKIIFRVFNDGIGFRYLIEGGSKETKKIIAEKTVFNFPLSAKAWLHPHAVAQSGWEHTQPSYEEYYKMGINVGVPSDFGQGWSFPALFQSAGHWVLVSETDVLRNYCGSHLAHLSPEGEYSIAFAQPDEGTGPNAPLLPESVLPWATPWRIINIGNSLGSIVESTLTTDLASPSKIKDVSFVKSGKSSWSWVLLKDGATVYDVQKKFIDYAAEMKWNYCLIDALWDTQIGYEKIEELAKYANLKNVGLILWYNSNGSWNTAPQTPKDKMHDPDIRKQEFEKLQKMGIKGLKIDFFGGDGQSMMTYYQDILEDAAKFGLVVNFHGSTIPRGWTRTYPNLVSMEAVRGFEFLTFGQQNTNNEPNHCCILPFTRNAIAPMDFTPVCFSEIPNMKRLTSNGFEIALSVVFQSGIQHYAEIPEGMKAQPDYVIDFMASLPLSWDDVKFIDGYPGEYVVIARKAGKKWYVGAINGINVPKKINLDLSVLENIKGGTIITDGENNRSFTTRKFEGMKTEIELMGYGGFVVQVE